MTIRYDGTDFRGWQRQASGRTVQGVLEEIVGRLERGADVSIVAAGRTDAGVHATAQVAHVDLERAASIDDLRYRLNRMLPEDIYLSDVRPAESGFHARFRAVRRQYCYELVRGRDPFSARYSWQIDHDLEPDRMRSAAAALIGRHDFTALSKVNPDTPGMICDLQRLEILEEGGRLRFVIESDRFLYGMIRLLVGLLVDVGRGRRPVEEAARVLASRDRSMQSQAAPASGLFFSRVWYPSDDDPLDRSS